MYIHIYTRIQIYIHMHTYSSDGQASSWKELGLYFLICKRIYIHIVYVWCIHMCMYKYVECVCVCVCVYIDIFTYTHTHTRTHTNHTHTHTHAHTHTHTHKHTHTHTHTQGPIDGHDLDNLVPILTHTHAHTHTHTGPHRRARSWQFSAHPREPTLLRFQQARHAAHQNRKGGHVCVCVCVCVYVWWLASPSCCTSEPKR